MESIRIKPRNKSISIFAVTLALIATGIFGHAGPAWAQRFNHAGISLRPQTVNFGSLSVGSATGPVVVTLQNVTSSAISITGVTVSLAEVNYSGPALPVTLNPGDSIQVALSFSPDAVANFRGAVLFALSNGGFVREGLNGAGIAIAASTPPPGAELSAGSSSLTFGGVTVGASASQTVTLSNASASDVTISGVSIAGAGFNATGVPTGLILAPGQTSTLTVTFNPAAAGNSTGSVSISGADGSSATIVLSGDGQAVQVLHSVVLNWDIDPSAANGYNVYSSAVSGGPYTLLTGTPVVPTTYTDSSVQTTQTYYYVVTAVAADGTESNYSSEVSATVP